MYYYNILELIFKLKPQKMMSQIKSTKEIEKQLSKAQSWTSLGNTDVSGMTYEEGVENALRWVLGEEDSEPIENEFSEDES